MKSDFDLEFGENQGQIDSLIVTLYWFTHWKNTKGWKYGTSDLDNNTNKHLCV
jgi:hypothetical protein